VKAKRRSSLLSTQRVIRFKKLTQSCDRVPILTLRGPRTLTTPVSVSEWRGDRSGKSTERAWQNTVERERNAEREVAEQWVSGGYRDRYERWADIWQLTLCSHALLYAVQLQDVSVTDTATVKLRPVGLFTLFGPGPDVSTDSKQCNKCCTLGAPKAKWLAHFDGQIGRVCPLL